MYLKPSRASQIGNNKESVASTVIERMLITGADSSEFRVTNVGRQSESSGEMMRDSGEVKAKTVEDALLELET